MDWDKNWTNRQFWKTCPDALTDAQKEDMSTPGKPGRMVTLPKPSPNCNCNPNLTLPFQGATVCPM